MPISSSCSPCTEEELNLESNSKINMFEQFCTSEDLKKDYQDHKELSFYKSRYSIFSKISIFLFILNIILSILLAITLKSKANPTFLQDYLIRKFQPHSHDLMKFNHLLQSENKIETLNKGHNVIPVHSHNDYWRQTPLFDALKLGINSVEADVWYLPSSQDSESNLPQLYVGHRRFRLSSYRTLNSLYLSNLESLLDDVNSKILEGNESNSKHGLFYDDPEKTLYLVIDIKTDPIDTFKVLETHLKPFITKDYLTYYNQSSNQFHYGPITIIISGNIPYELIRSQNIRYAFIDAPLHDLELSTNFDNSTSIFASSSLKKLTGSKKVQGEIGLSSEQKKILTQRIKIAHENGIKVRVWDTPKWPISLRNQVWRDLLELDVDLLNVDDLNGALNF